MIWFPLVFLMILFWINHKNAFDFHEAVINMILFFSEVIITILILSTRDKEKPAKSFRRYIGLADLLVFLPACIMFSTVNFVLFFLSTLFCSLLLYGIFMTVGKNRFGYRIPLAGFAGVSLAILFIIDYFYPVNLHDDIIHLANIYL